jgi:hypothetical protein
MVANLAAIGKHQISEILLCLTLVNFSNSTFVAEALDKAINEHDSSTSESVTGSVDSVQRMPDLLETTGNSSSK